MSGDTGIRRAIVELRADRDRLAAEIIAIDRLIAALEERVSGKALPRLSRNAGPVTRAVTDRLATLPVGAEIGFEDIADLADEPRKLHHAMATLMLAGLVDRVRQGRYRVVAGAAP